MKKVLLISNFPAPYFVEYVVELSKYFNVRVVFECTGANHREKSWFKRIDEERVECIFLKNRYSKNRLPSFSVLKQLKKKDIDRIIVCNPGSPTGAVALMYCRRKRIPVLLQSEGGFPGSGRGIKERFKKYIMEKSIGFLTGMSGGNDYFSMYGASSNTLMHYPFSSLRQNEIDKRPICQEDKEKLKKRLGVKEKHIVLYVGRFIEIKGISETIKSCSNLPDDVGVYFIGGTLSAEMIRMSKEYNVKNLHTISFLHKEELKNYYQCSDIFIMMTQGDTWGLVINEAMANGLPVITTTSCVAGNELIENGVNGYLVDKKDCSSANEHIRFLIANPTIRNEMAKKNIEKIQEYSIENMANVIADHINSTFKF